MSALPPADSGAPEVSVSATASPFRSVYPWLLIAATFLSLGLATGATTSVGVFLPHMMQDLAWTAATISGAIALFPLVNGVLQPAMGWLVMRVPPLMVLAAGGATVGIGLMVTQFTSEPWHLLGSYALLSGVGYSASSLVVAAALINRTFPQRRGLALGLASAGLPVGRLLLIPGSSWLILGLGWRPAWGVLGSLVLGGAVLCVLFHVLRPRGYRSPESGDKRADGEADLPVIWWRHGSFYRLAGAYCGCGFTVHLFSTHLPSFGLERGIPVTTTALALGIGAALAALGVVTVGWLADLMPQRRLLALAYVVRGLGFGGLVFAQTPLSFMILTVIAGSTFLMTGNLTVGLAGNAFGRNRAPMIFGFTLVGHQLAGTLSIAAGGLISDWTGTYGWAFAAAAALMIVSAVVSYGIRENPMPGSIVH